MFTRRTMLIGLGTASALASISGYAMGQGTPGDLIETGGGPVRVIPVSHASLVLEQGDNVFYVDPVGGAVPYAGLPAPTAILITHSHPDHFDVATLVALIRGADVPIVAPPEVARKLPDSLMGMSTVLGNGEGAIVRGVEVKAYPAYNTSPDKLQYHPRGTGNGYMLALGGANVYVAGDTEDVPELLELSGIDVMFLPMNQPYTMTPEQAAHVVESVRPRIVYPYHSRGTDPQVFADLVAAGSSGAEVRIRDWYATP